MTLLRGHPSSHMQQTMSGPPESLPKDRYSSAVAADVVRAGQPDLEAGLSAIRNTLNTLGTQPGVYRMYDARDQILYVGKAKSLRNRVANYTQISRLPRRILRMVAQTRGMTIITTTSEAEALLLEAQLIQRFQPPFNVLLRDGKSFPFIVFSGDHAFARLSKHRGARQPHHSYYGPFASPGAVTTTLNAMQKLFLLRSCTDSFFANRSRPCLLYQIRRCSGPCVGRIDAESYGELVQDAKDFLLGRSQAIHAKLTARMQAAADEREFELAAVYRDRLRALATIETSRATSSETESLDADIIALANRDGVACVQIFFVRGGQNWGHRAVFPAHVAGVPDDEILTSFLGQFYSGLQPARQILLDRELPEASLLADALSARAGFRVHIQVPKRGYRHQLMEQAKRNATEAVDRRLAESTTQLRNLDGLASLFGLDRTPQRIEIYDNSHVQGTNALGAMVVAGPQGFIKAAYRKFNMKAGEGEYKIIAGDDFGMMHAMLSRRFSRLEQEDPDRESGNWPDLLLIDGGKGQVSAACTALAEQGVSDIAVVGVSKGPDRNAGRETFHLPDGRELTLPVNDPLLFFLQRLRDEAHRFAIGAHRQKRSRAMTVSTLDEIPGIGPARKKALLLHFGTARAVRTATLDELRKVPGIRRATAEAVYAYFHPDI